MDLGGGQAYIDKDKQKPILALHEEHEKQQRQKEHVQEEQRKKDALNNLLEHIKQQRSKLPMRSNRSNAILPADRDILPGKSFVRKVGRTFGEQVLEAQISKEIENSGASKAESENRAPKRPAAKKANHHRDEHSLDWAVLLGVESGGREPKERRPKDSERVRPWREAVPRADGKAVVKRQRKKKVKSKDKGIGGVSSKGGISGAYADEKDGAGKENVDDRGGEEWDGILREALRQTKQVGHFPITKALTQQDLPRAMKQDAPAPATAGGSKPVSIAQQLAMQDPSIGAECIVQRKERPYDLEIVKQVSFVAVASSPRTLRPQFIAGRAYWPWWLPYTGIFFNTASDPSSL